MTPQLSFPIPCQRSQLYHQMMNWKVSQLRGSGFLSPLEGWGCPPVPQDSPHHWQPNLPPDQSESTCLSGLKNNRLLWRISILGKISSMWFPSSKCQPECNSVITQSITNPCIVVTIQAFKPHCLTMFFALHLPFWRLFRDISGCSWNRILLQKACPEFSNLYLSQMEQQASEQTINFLLGILERFVTRGDWKTWKDANSSRPRLARAQRFHLVPAQWKQSCFDQAIYL